MIKENIYPILEFDNNIEALINPTIIKNLINQELYIPNKLIICFFKEAIEQLKLENQIYEYFTTPGENEVCYYKFKDQDLLIVHGIVGAPACSGILEEAIALGVKTVIFCGGAGSLRKEITVGKLVLIDSAIRDEGLSYHYIEPSREIESDREVLAKIKMHLDYIKADYIVGKTWTTDAFYRETIDRINLRKKEGALIVEMEQSAMIAVSKFRNIKYGAIIYGGDDLTKNEWDNRCWRSRKNIRYDLTILCSIIIQSI